MKTSIQLLKQRWHNFWIMWHETKYHYYGSHWHEKRKLKHEQKSSIEKTLESEHKSLVQDKNIELSSSESASSSEKISKSP